MADDGYEFRGWEGDCSGTEYTCSLRMNEEKNVGVKFAKIANSYSLNIITVPDNDGKIAVEPRPNADNGQYREGTEVKLLAAANQGFRLQGWQGACSGSNNVCSLVMDDNKQVAGIFHAIGELPTLTIRVLPEAGGRVQVDHKPNTPNNHYRVGTVVELRAIPADGYKFRGWEGGCSGPSPSCTLTMRTSQVVLAGFAKKTHSLSVTAIPENGGRVGVSPPPNAPNGQYLHGTQVTLAADPASGFAFRGWTGNCSDTERLCRLLMNQDQRVTANFSRRIHTLSVHTEPAAGGKVTLSPTPADTLAADSLYRFAHGTEVKLEAIPAEGFEFRHWRGDCENQSSRSHQVCVLVMDADQSVVAVFERLSYTLTANGILITGSEIAVEHGSLGFEPAPVTDAGRYGHGTEVIITALPDPGFKLSGWKGHCADQAFDGTVADPSVCILLMTEDQEVAVEFELTPVIVDDVNVEPVP